MKHFDQLVMNDADADILFASSYIRGFISLAAASLAAIANHYQNNLLVKLAVKSKRLNLNCLHKIRQL